MARDDARVGGEATLPRAFADAVASMRAADVRAGVHLEEMPAPRRIATYSFALTGDLTVRDEDRATGRLILLHEPDGNDAWDGTFRCVAYVRAEVEDEVGDDTMLGEVGWSWLSDALESRGADHHAIAGTVTCVTTRSFGQMADDPRTTQIEIRASWTPDSPVGRHVEAWTELMCSTGGLEPVPEGVAVMANRRARS